MFFLWCWSSVLIFDKFMVISEGHLELCWQVGRLLDLDNLLQMNFWIFAALVRARELVWGPMLGHVPEKRARFVLFCNVVFKKYEVQSLDLVFNNCFFLYLGVAKKVVD